MDSSEKCVHSQLHYQNVGPEQFVRTPVDPAKGVNTRETRKLYVQSTSGQMIT